MSRKALQIRTFRPRSFALVLVLFLVVLLVSAGAGLAVTAGAEAIHANRILLDLKHELALESLLAVLPEWPQGDAAGSPGRDSRVAMIGFRFGEGEVHAEIRAESQKRNLRSGDVRTVPSELEALARTAGLPVENVRALPLHRSERSRLGTFLWFDQIVAPTAFEEVFPWRFRGGGDGRPAIRACWSDLVSFWSGRGRNLSALEVETRIGSEVRRWYLVVEIAEDRPRILHWSRI